jgi:Mrp family chromosome partitioning ATPase
LLFVRGVPAPSSQPTAPTIAASDLRRAISRQTWLANRARNALQRPAFIGAISVGTFVTALVSMVVVPRAQRQGTPPIRIAARPDTFSIAATAALARVRLVETDSALAAARSQVATAAAQRPPDTLYRLSAVHRDSLAARAATLERLVSRAEQAPLPSSYKALAELPELRADSRIRALVDSLSEIEREREGFGAVGGVDPIFVALTSRANEIGRAIQAIASDRLKAMRAELEPSTEPAPAVVMTPAVDTASRIAERDSAQLAMNQANDSLTRLRQIAHALDLEETRARERASAVAPPLAFLASAFVLSAVIGFATALIGELRRPRVTDANELERFLGVRVLSSVETQMPSAERGRREADRAAPPYFDPSAEGYQLAYLGLATEHPTLLAATITGDDPAIAAVVTCNLAAISADEARNTLVVDLEPSCSVSAALRTRVHPGIVDIRRGDVSWPDVTIAAAVGRDKTVDLVPYGAGASAASPAPPAAPELAALLRKDTARLARYYDAIFVAAAPEDTAAGLPAALPSPDVVFCAQPGITPLRHLRDCLEGIRAAGGTVRGIVLWNAERPLLPTPTELASRARHDRTDKSQVALATT